MSAPTETTTASACLRAEPVRDLLCLAAPFALFLFAPAGAGAAVASVFAAFLVPGLFLLRLVLGPRHPWRALPARFGLATALALVPFGLAAALSTKLHWTFDRFLVTYGVLTAATVALALLGRARAPGSAAPASFPALTIRPLAGLVVLLGLALGLLAASRGDSRVTEAWLTWTLAGLALGLVAALVLLLQGRRAEAAASDGEAASALPERLLRLVLWCAVALLTWHLMAVAYERQRGDDDDTTYVSRAVDLVTGEPMDLYEPSLGEGVPMNPGFVLATTSMLDGAVAWVTGVSASAAHKTYLPPLFVLAGVSALAALVGLLVRGDRVLVPLVLLVVLIVLSGSSDRHRSFSHFLFYRALQPKSVHFGLLAPLQLGALVCLARAPGLRAALLASLLVLAGHLVHPWSTVLSGLWGGAFLVASCLGSERRSALGAAVPVLATALVLGVFHYLDSTRNLFGPAVVSKVEAPYVTELVAAIDGSGVRLDAARTVGSYSLFRLGILSVPWLLVLACWLRETRVVLVCALAALALCFVEPIARLATLALPVDLMWRNRMMLPSTAALAAAALVAYAVVQAGGRGIGLRRGAGAWAAALVTLGLVVSVVALLPSKLLVRDGALEHPSKISALTRAVVEASGGPDGAPFLLAPPHSDILVELTQVQARARLVVVRPLIFDWAFGKEERHRRTRLLRKFAEGRMTPKGFRSLREEFPVDWALVDGREEGADAARALLTRDGWTRVETLGVVELWRLPVSEGAGG